MFVGYDDEGLSTRWKFIDNQKTNEVNEKNGCVTRSKTQIWIKKYGQLINDLITHNHLIVIKYILKAYCPIDN